MFNIEALQKDARAYFENLPLYMQVNITQSGVSMNTKEELEAYCETIQRDSSE